MDQALALLKECVQLCAELEACLREERTALTALKTEALVQCNFRKETLGIQLKDKRRQLRISVKVLTVEEAAAWAAHEAEWLRRWDSVRRECEFNQKLLQHSLKNLGLIVDNLRRIFGVNRTYSAAGKQVNATTSGSVVEARL